MKVSFKKKKDSMKVKENMVIINNPMIILVQIFRTKDDGNEPFNRNNIEKREKVVTYLPEGERAEFKIVTRRENRRKKRFALYLARLFFFHFLRGPFYP